MSAGSGISGTGATFGGVNGRSTSASARWILVGGGSVPLIGRVAAMVGVGGGTVDGRGGGSDGEFARDALVGSGV